MSKARRACYKVEKMIPLLTYEQLDEAIDAAARQTRADLEKVGLRKQREKEAE